MRCDAKFPWKVAWITGASGAICGEIAKRLASAGVTVAATARPSEALTALAASSGKIKPFPADVLKPEELRETVGRIERELGAIDLALLGAGMYAPFDIRAIDLDGFRRSMALNVDGVVNAVAAVLPPMLARKSRPYRHHGLALRLCRVAGQRQLWRKQGGGHQSRREHEARIGGNAASPSPSSIRASSTPRSTPLTTRRRSST